ncbi:winged helix-turn-helix transcriptional regulator [Allofrancisella guangzhouensis]|uniref:ArsR family transcriptional regulator n=1 Tax=Allofrancisella guangzhouensis TaxID=594679 RepID=A0A0A8E414_9GAMM|nr:metalloregulator ArsR/SmtB family transcription factor [Allofrancisella guangzhouensis]AJC48674.1 ArsR family transcriptional regulator [Allofrancisella guangzhouensis]MBK2027481.1 winged helix-turn-helix transcriptional regulator [Allofrancisella guangzhouensis]MBK2044505.1 winged helix-turn-helix transcriptional regulator [Allofrancisella guangzhouensis]MBK2045402.1 winged helix-turn-helix transcriptional regulator [Allofrancisella guangzhouensis]
MDLVQMQKNASKAADMLKAISHKSRLLILCLLTKGEMSVGELAKYSDLSQSAFSQHLSILRKKGLVKVRKESQVCFYSIKDKGLVRILEALHSVYCGDK